MPAARVFGAYYLRKSKYSGMSASEAKRLKQLATENPQLKKLLAEALLGAQVSREALRR